MWDPMDDFRLHMPVSTWEKSGDPNPLRIGGIVSTEVLDRQGEKVIQDGLDFTPFLEYGWFNDNHGQKTTDVLGYPTDVKKVKKGDALPNGKKAKAKGHWAEGYLMNTPEGRKVFALAQSLEGNEHRRLGFSIEGKIRARGKDRSEVATAIVKNVAVTHCPVNNETEMVALSKALMAGHAVEDPGPSPGEGFPLRSEQLDPKLANQEYDDDWVRSISFVDADEVVAKGDNQGDNFQESEIEMSIMDFVDHWADATSDFIQSDLVSELTKSEATIIVASRLPHLSEEQIEAIVEEATGGN